MDAFDPELHLRLLGERMLVGRADLDHWGSPLAMAARALVAAGAMEPAAAEIVLDDYGLATALREGDPERVSMRAHRIAAGPTAAPELQPRRVVACDRAIERDEGTLHVRSVSLDDDSTTLAIAYRTQPAASRRRPSRMSMMMGAGPAAFGPVGRLHQVTLADDRGTTTGCHFSGGGSDQEWRGSLHADRPLAKDTKWIEIDGERIELVDDSPAGSVTIEPLDDQPAALRHLWAILSAPDRFHGPPTDLEPAIEVLVAAGAIDPEDPALDDVRAVASMIDPHQPPPAAGAVRRLPEPWSSLLSRRGRMDGPTGTAPIGLVTPPFDGVVVAAISLESGEEGFDVEVEVAPDYVMRDPFEDAGFGPTLAWWARDDRGNHYMGSLGGWSGGDGRGAGDITFHPALDPAAGRLELMPTAQTSRAVLAFDLPWAAKEPSP